MQISSLFSQRSDINRECAMTDARPETKVLDGGLGTELAADETLVFKVINRVLGVFPILPF